MLECIFRICLLVWLLVLMQGELVALVKTSGDREFEFNGNELFYNAAQKSKKKVKDTGLKLENSILKSKVEALGEILKKHVKNLRIASNKQVELVFLVDSSASVGAENFESELKFVQKLLSDFTVSENATRVSVIVYSSPDNVVRYIDHITSPSANNHKCGLLHYELPNIKYAGGGTYTRGALLEAQVVLKHARNDSRQVLFLITDGFSNGGDPIPVANELKEQGVTIFTFGIRNGNIKELYHMASQPGEEYSYILDSFGEFEAMVRRALHQDLKVGKYQPLYNSTLCNSLCVNGKECCDKLASCNCGTHTGHFACVCQPGYYGPGFENSCKLCPNGTYSLGVMPGDVSVCLPCPDLNHVTLGPAVSVEDCHCKKGFVFKENHCKVITCPKLAAPAKGYFVKKSCGNVLNAACGVRCQVGYQLIGSSIRLCQDDGTWSGKEAKCIVKTCPSPTAPENGAVICSNEDHIIDTECEFSCVPGHILVGSRHRSCLPLARWDGLHTTCKPLYCPPLPKIVNGVIIPENCTNVKQEYGIRCNITCIRGYQLNGPRSRVCDGTGKWSGRDVNNCIDVTPPLIECPENIVVQTDINENYATVNWTIPRATDNSGMVPNLWTRPAIHLPLKVKIGQTIITYIASDATHHKSKCNFTITVEDKEPPVVDRCDSPPPFLIDNGDNGSFTWDPPLFHDNSGKDVKVTWNPDTDKFSYGTTAVTYTALDIYGNSAQCIVNITVEENVCQQSLDPVNGHANCTSDVDYVHCTLICEEGYAFAVQPHDYFCTYDSDGSVLAPDNTIDPFPDCSLAEAPNSISQDGAIRVEGDVTVCEDPLFLRQLEENVRQKITQLLMENCNNELRCLVEDMSTVCDQVLSELEEESNILSRKKRQTTELLNIPHSNEAVYSTDAVIALHKENKIEIQFHMKSQRKIKHNNQTNVQQLFSAVNRMKDAVRRSAKKGMVLDIGREHNRKQIKLKEIEFKNEARLLCAPGSVLKGSVCVKCPLGTYWNMTTGSCSSCAIGYYQPNEGSTYCLSCPPGTSTRKIHAKNLRDCRSLCPPGSFGRRRKHWRSNIPGLTPCTTCTFGSYQPKSGQTDCWHCPGNWTTIKRGSTNIDDCRASCPPGEISETGLAPCIKCPSGYNQPHSGRKVCYSNDGSESIGIECLSIPCQNGGICHSVDFDYIICDCPRGYLGSFCEIEVKKCDSSPCLNGATCNDTEPSDYICSCAPGYVGANCEVDIDECSSDPCQNGGTCVDGIHSFSCLCADGFEGQYCHKNIDDCIEDQCLHKSMCIDGIAGYSCVCAYGYSGKHCEVEPYDPCDHRPCQNDGDCIGNEFEYICVCPEGFEGKNCEVNVDDCATNPCYNNGICVDLVSGYECVCSEYYTGIHCETRLPTEYSLRFAMSGTTDYVLVRGPHFPLTQVSVCLWLKSTDRFNYGTVFSYATNISDNTFTLTDYNGFVLYVNGERIVTDITANDGFWHSVCVMWDSSDGEWSIYIDGKLGDNGSGLANGTYIPGEGILILGQEQDLMGSGFSEAESFMGFLSSLTMWDYILQVAEIWDLTMLCNVSSSTGNVFVWTDFLKGIRGDLKVENSSFCTDCIVPSAPFQGKVNVLPRDENGSGSIAIYTCNAGFSLRWGNRELTVVERKCLKQGSWEGPTPICIRKSCGFPGYFPKGMIRGRSYLYTDTIHYYCIKGYEQVGAPVRVCMANGKWSGDIPKCIGRICSALTPPRNGKLRSLLLETENRQWNSGIILEFGHQVEVECDFGFELEGSNIVTCLEDGQWDEPISLCQPIGCVNPPNVSNSVRKSSIKVIYDFGEQLIYGCKIGYVPLQNSSFVCGEDGKWKGHFDCKLIECPSPQILQNGEISHNSDFLKNNETDIAIYIYNSTIEMSCNLGYKLSGPSIRWCLQNGTWSLSDPHCEKLSCNLSDLPVDGNAMMKNGYFNISGNLYGDWVIFKCNAGYTFHPPSLYGEIQWTCDANASWILSSSLNSTFSSSQPLCYNQPQKCSEPKEPDNGYILREDSAKNLSIGSMIKMKCRLGYLLLGSEVSVCKEDGNWSDDNTTCVPIQCPKPTVLSNTKLMNPATLYVFGNMLTFYCEEGYEAYGIMTSRCLASGKWSRVRGKCARISCGKPTIINGAIITGDSYLFQDRVTYKCPPGMRAPSDAEIYCLVNGTWSGTAACELL